MRLRLCTAGTTFIRRFPQSARWVIDSCGSTWRDRCRSRRQSTTRSSQRDISHVDSSSGCALRVNLLALMRLNRDQPPSSKNEQRLSVRTCIERKLRIKRNAVIGVGIAVLDFRAATSTGRCTSAGLRLHWKRRFGCIQHSQEAIQ
jgi:hypothetical protein